MGAQKKTRDRSSDSEYSYTDYESSGAEQPQPTPRKTGRAAPPAGAFVPPPPPPLGPAGLMVNSPPFPLAAQRAASSRSPIRSGQRPKGRVVEVQYVDLDDKDAMEKEKPKPEKDGDGKSRKDQAGTRQEEKATDVIEEDSEVEIEKLKAAARAHQPTQR